MVRAAVADPEPTWQSLSNGLRIVFAHGGEDADSCIESFLGHDSNSRSLTVVSSDRRIRDAVSRRRARPLTAEAFLDRKDDPHAFSSPSASPPPEIDRDASMDAGEAAFWAETFRDVEQEPGIRDVTSPDALLLTDAEIQRILDRGG